MMDSGTTVSAEIGLMLIVPRQPAVPLWASLLYSADDPYAVRMAFHAGPGEPVVWIFGRDLLAAGLAGPAGDGDVRAWPSPSREVDGETALNVVLSSPFGRAHCEAPMTAVAEFLCRTCDVVPAGREGDFVDIGEELDSLLRRA